MPMIYTGIVKEMVYHRDLSTSFAIMSLQNEYVYGGLSINGDDVLYLRDLPQETSAILAEINKGWGISKTNLFPLQLRIMYTIARGRGMRVFEIEPGKFATELSTDESVELKLRRQRNIGPWFEIRKIGAR